MLENIQDFFAWLIAGLSGENAFIFASVAYVSMLLLERIIYLIFAARRGEWDEQDALTNVGTILLGNLGGTLVTGAVFIILYQFFFQFRLFELPYTAWWSWALVFVLHEFCYYLDHRLAHRIGFFWMFHQVHHASNRMNLTVAARGSFFDGLAQWTYWVIPSLLGVPILMLFIVKFFTNQWGQFNHTRLIGRLGFLENWLATPANHRVHHGRQAKYLDRNYGQVTVIYDRMFGSFQREEEEPDYGLVKRLESRNPVTHQLVGFDWMWKQMKQADKWSDKLRYLVHPPGWHHAGQHETTQVLQGRPAQTDPPE